MAAVTEAKGDIDGKTYQSAETTGGTRRFSD